MKWKITLSNSENSKKPSQRQKLCPRSYYSQPLQLQTSRRQSWSKTSKLEMLLCTKVEWLSLLKRRQIKKPTSRQLSVPARRGRTKGKRALPIWSSTLKIRRIPWSEITWDPSFQGQGCCSFFHRSVQGSWLEGLQEIGLIHQEVWMKENHVVCKWVGLGRGSYSRRPLRHMLFFDPGKKRVAELLICQLLRGVTVPRIVICFHLLRRDYVRFVSSCTCSGS